MLTPSHIGSKRTLRVIFAASVLLAFALIAQALFMDYGPFDLPNPFIKADAPPDRAPEAAPPPLPTVIRGGHR